MLSSGGGLAPCRSRLPGKGGPSLADILLLWLDLGPSGLHVGSSISDLSWCFNLDLVPVHSWAIDPGFVAPTFGEEMVIKV